MIKVKKKKKTQMLTKYKSLFFQNYKKTVPQKMKKVKLIFF